MAQRHLRARFVVGVVGALAIAGFGAGVALAADHAVAISGSSFSPANLTVAVGDTVTWTNSDQISHTATADGGSFDTGTLSNNESGTVTFATAGSFPYHCSIHPNMTGTITVEAPAAEPTPAPTAAPAAGQTAAPTNPPTDTVDGVLGSPIGLLGVALVIGAAWIVGFAIARRRFSRG